MRDQQTSCGIHLPLVHPHATCFDYICTLLTLHTLLLFSVHIFSHPIPYYRSCFPPSPHTITAQQFPSLHHQSGKRTGNDIIFSHFTLVAIDAINKSQFTKWSSSNSSPTTTTCVTFQEGRRNKKNKTRKYTQRDGKCFILSPLLFTPNSWLVAKEKCRYLIGFFNYL